MAPRLVHRVQELAAIRCRSKPATRELLPLLDGLKVIDDRPHLVGLKDEFRHVGVAGKDAFGQRLGKPFDFELARKRTKRRRLRVRTGAAAADRMAAGTVGGQQRLTAPSRRIPAP